MSLQAPASGRTHVDPAARSVPVVPPSLERIGDVAAAIAPRLLRTPLVRWPGATLAHGEHTWVKLELLQRSGSFKARGALNSLLTLVDPSCGVVAFSAGNHAIATAWAGRELGVDVTVVMPRSANAARVARVREYGGHIVFGNSIGDLMVEVERIQRDEGRALVHPFEGPAIVEGTATLGIEIVDDALAQSFEPEVVVVPIGGGGLAAGVASAVKQRLPHCRVIGVEPAGADGMRQSLASGAPLAQVRVDTIADSLGAPMHRPLSYALVERYVDEIVTVDDAALRDAMRRLFDIMKLAVEPACAASLAALGAIDPVRLADRRVVLIACGSNIDRAGWFAHVEGGPSDGRTSGNTRP